jgi:phosphoenolpyruvate phosphomutase
VTNMERKTSQLRKIIEGSETNFIMEAHNGLSAKIVEEAGFSGIWGSGLSISAAMGVRDNNEASWTQVLEVVEFMSDATSIPILLDGDTGYGNFNNMRRLVRKLEQVSVGGVCIEDKLFPKTNSFISGEAQPLADIDEFCGKIKAAKDSQLDPDFCVVARVEAFIAGWGLSEAMKRAEAYRLAGADAVLMHSKRADAGEIEVFMKEWSDRLPVVIVPTKYYSTPTAVFRELGISTVIWANHNVRASVRAMQEITDQIFQDQSLINVEGNIVSVSEVFRLQGADELKEAEKKYLPTEGKTVNAVILAASKGSGFGELTADIPKALLTVKGKSILDQQLEAFGSMGVKDISIVAGYGAEHVKRPNLNTVVNENFENTFEVYSLASALKGIRNDTVVAYGDILFRPYVLHELLSDDSGISIIVDSSAEIKTEHQDLVLSSHASGTHSFLEPVSLLEVNPELKGGVFHGEFIGLWGIKRDSLEIVERVLQSFRQQGRLEKVRMWELLSELARETTVSVRYIQGGWCDIDSLKDLITAST